MAHLRPCILECFSCYGKFDRHYVESPAKCALQKSHPLTELNYPMVLLSLTPIFLYSLLFVILFYQICSHLCSHSIVNTFFNPQVSSKPFPSFPWLEICFSPRVHPVTAVLPHIEAVSVVTLHTSFRASVSLPHGRTPLLRFAIFFNYFLPFIIAVIS